MAKKWIIGLALAAVLGCGACGVALIALGAAADDAEAPLTAVAVSGAHPAELIAFWDGGMEKLALFADGSAKKWVRQHWTGAGSPVVCGVKADLEGTWSVTGAQLTLAFSEGKWADCQGDKDFEPLTEQYTFELESTPQSASPFGLTLWLQSATHRDGFNKACADPGSCPKYTPEPL